MTLYLKYRSQRISELDIVAVEMLGKLLLNGNFPHALLFCGSRGTGKTSAARILAKAINCTSPDGYEPCNKCEMCLEITSGRAIDVIEIDAASNRGIDEMRELREKVRLAPISGKYKIYIIDEVHMLTLEAANALLKTLEEPPENTLFVLCTTDPQRLPETVVSRCMVIRFPKPTISEVVDKLQRIVLEEKFNIEKDDLEKIAVASKGSFRDAIKLLEQVGNSGLGTNAVLGMSGSIGVEDLFALTDKGDVNEALGLVGKLVEQGVDMRGFVEKCVEYLRGQMISLTLSSQNVTKQLTEIEGLSRVYEQMRTSVIAQLPLEVWIVSKRKSSIDVVSPREPVVVKTEEIKVEKESKKIDKTEDKVPVYEIKAEEIVKVEPIVEKKNPEIDEVPVAVVDGVDGKLEDVVSRWPDVLKTVRPVNHSIEALLKSTRPVGWDGRRIELEAFYKFHKDKLESEKCRSIVEESVAKVMGVKVAKLSLRLTEKKQIHPSDNIVGKVEEDIVSAAAEIFRAEVI